MGVNEINFTDTDAKTVKFGAHQGTDVGYNVQTAVDSQNKMVATFEVINNSADQGQLFLVGTKAKEALKTDKLEMLADKGYYDVVDFEKCENNNSSCYVPKPSYTNSTGNPRYFSDKFKYDSEKDTFLCPENHVLHCITKRKDTNKLTYANAEACRKCANREKCTTSSRGKLLHKDRNHIYSEIIDVRTKANKSKSMKRQEIIEHVFGTVKRTMGFTYFLLRGFKKVTAEMSIVYFCYNLKRSISVLGHSKIQELLSIQKIEKVASV